LGLRQEGHPAVNRAPTPEIKVEKAFILGNRLPQALHGKMDVINEDDDICKQIPYINFSPKHDVCKSEYLKLPSRI
jgi:hypothetical protein